MKFLNFSIENKIATITLNDPKKLNAMSQSMGKEFSKLLTKIKKDKSIRVVILTGAGRAFSAGGDLKMLIDLTKKSKPQIAASLKTFYKSYLGIKSLPQPVIAKINGPAVGAGFCLALACDLKYAVTNAKMGANFSKLGIPAGMAGTHLLTQLTNACVAKEILFLGELFTSQKAKEWGLINQVCSASKLNHHVLDVAKRISQNAPMALSKIKAGVELAQFKTMNQMFDYDAKAQADCFKTKDFLEGLQSIKEKRTPIFTGK